MFDYLTILIKSSTGGKNMSYKVLDLFCGAGGLSRGFLDANYKVVLGVDFDDAALKTFANNHGSTKSMKLNLFDHDNINEIKKYIDEKNFKIDVLVGGPPCQGFSLAGKRDEEDDRNVLYKAMVKTAKSIKPRVVVLENVPGLLTLYKGSAAKKIFNDFEKLGYTMNAKILYAPNYGVPQIRKRVFFVGLLNHEEKFDYPSPIIENENDFITTKDAISDLPSLISDFDYSLNMVREYQGSPTSEYQQQMRRKSTSVYNHYPIKHHKKTTDTIALVPDGGNYKDLPEELSKRFKYKESMKRYNSMKPSLTIDTGHRTHFHYKYNRIPTVRENARLQSFPDDFIFYGNKQEQYKQVGNAVPPIIGKHLAMKIKECLDYEKV